MGEGAGEGLLWMEVGGRSVALYSETEVTEMERTRASVVEMYWDIGVYMRKVVAIAVEFGFNPPKQSVH